MLGVPVFAGKRPGPAKASAGPGRAVLETIEWEKGLIYLGVDGCGAGAVLKIKPSCL